MARLGADRLTRSKSPGYRIKINRARSPSVPLKPPSAVVEVPSDAEIGAEPAAEPSAAPEPAAQEPAAGEPAAQEPAAQEPAAGEPAAPDASSTGNWWSSGGWQSGSRGSTTSSWKDSPYGMPMPGKGNPNPPPWARSATPRSRRPSASDTASDTGSRFGDVDMPTAMHVMKTLEIDETALKAL